MPSTPKIQDGKAPSGEYADETVKVANIKSNDSEKSTTKQDDCPAGRQDEKTEEAENDAPSDDTLEEPHPDLEALTPVPTRGPVYSVFSKSQKRYIVFMTAWAGFFSPLSANIYFPALNQLATDLHVSNGLINLTLTSYMIFQGLAPTILGDLADMAGRRPAYTIGFIIYIAACIGLALQHSYAALFILRCMQSTGSSGTVALGYGIVADIATTAERGTYTGIVQAGALMGPSLGPVIGGLLAEFLGWRAIFWFLSIMAAVFLIPFVIFFPETGRSVVGNGSIPPQGWNMSLMNYLQVRKHRHSHPDEQEQTLPPKPPLRFPNPLGSMHVIFTKNGGLVLLYSSILFAGYYDVTVSVPSQFEEIYHFNALQIGLCYLPFGVGCSLAAFLQGSILDWNYRRTCRNLGIVVSKTKMPDLRTFPIEKARLQVAIPLLYIACATIVAYGWFLHFELPLAAPLTILFLSGYSMTGCFNVLSTLLVDFFPKKPATATAANNFVRCLLGAGSTALLIPMIDGMGRGWCFTFVAAVLVATSPILWAVMLYGMRWREEGRVKAEAGREEEKARREAEESATGGGEGVLHREGEAGVVEEKKH